MWPSEVRVNHIYVACQLDGGNHKKRFHKTSLYGCFKAVVIDLNSDQRGW